MALIPRLRITEMLTQVLKRWANFNQALFELGCFLQNMPTLSDVGN